MVEPGRTSLGGRYELEGLLASGGMGQVWRGRDELLGRPVAVKVLRSEYTGDPTFLARFRAEAQNAAALNHPGIAAVYDYGEVAAADASGETLAYLVMELVEGEPLSTVLHRSGPLDLDTTLRLLGQAAAGLGEAHRAGMVHRDVKPANLMITPDGDVKITDFGIAWSARSVALTRTGQVIGTPQYLSPEQAEGRQATPASDVYALGLIGYECLAGHAAFDGDNAVTIALKQIRDEPDPLPGDLPERVRALVRRALAKDPAARLADGAAFAAAVATVRDGGSVAPAPDTRAVATASGRAGRRTGAAGSRPGAQRSSQRSVTRAPARRRSGVAMLLLPLLGLLAGAGIAAMVLAGLTGPPAPPSEAADQQVDATVVLDESDYVGRPIEEVAVQLASFGLTVQREARVTADAAEGTVLGIQPAGRALRAGDVVVVQVATGRDAPTGGSDGGVPARVETTAPPLPPTTDAPTTEPEASDPATGPATEEATEVPDTATGPTGTTDPGTPDGTGTEPPGDGTGEPGDGDPATDPSGSGEPPAEETAPPTGTSGGTAGATTAGGPTGSTDGTAAGTAAGAGSSSAGSTSGPPSGGA